jgi:Spy/CpxP family protein refolding chaperone
MGRIRMVVAATLAATVLSGCGTAIDSGFLRGADDGTFMEDGRTLQSMEVGEKKWGHRGPRGRHFGHGGLFGMVAKDLDLTAEQRQQLKDIRKKYAQTAQRPDFKKYREELETLLSADKVDEAALRAWIAARQADGSKHVATLADMAGEMRGVLTTTQIALIKTRLSGFPEAGGPGKGPGGPGGPGGKHEQKRAEFLKSLNLDADQQAAVDALHARIATSRKEGRAALKGAAVAFVDTGDKAALTAALTKGITTHLPTDEIVRVATLLDKEQRTKALSMLGRGPKHFGKKFRRHREG